MSVGLAVIARDEELNLPRLLASIDGAFDRAVLVDTGSKDNTVGVFQAWAREQAGMTFGVLSMTWKDDFAHARTIADQLLLYGSADDPGEKTFPLVDWSCWADADDAIVNAGHLRELAARAPAEVAALIFGYDYAQHPVTGECICHLRRERLVRAGRSRWAGRVHEAQIVDGPVQHVPDELCHWRHHKQATPQSIGQSNGRNLRILRAWLKDEPANPRVLAYLGTEEAIRGRHRRAVGYYRRYLQLTGTWDQEHAQVCRKLASSELALGRVGQARKVAHDAIDVLPAWPDSYLTLAECAVLMGEPAKAIVHAGRVLELGVPDTLLIINPLDYTAAPHRLLAVAHGMAGRLDEAAEHADTARRSMPDDPQLAADQARFRAGAKREHTAQTYILAAQQLVAHDEQLKALTLLQECVPAFATDHPQVVALRSQVRERLLWVDDPDAFAHHYQVGGSKPEDFHSDEESTQIAAALPRVGFLLDGLAEQAEAA